MQAKTIPKVEKFLASPAGERFRKFVGMLGSDADGERANASAMANRLLREAELTWGEVLGSGPAPSQGGQQTHIRDLEARLRLAKGQAELAQGAINSLQAQVNKLRTENDLQRRAIESMKKAANGTAQGKEVPRRYITKWQIDRHADAMEYSIALHIKGTGIDAVLGALGINPTDYSKPEGPAPQVDKPKRAYATKLQKAINELVDQIEEAMELNDWEQGFAGSMRELKYKISPKQAARLKELAKHAEVEWNDEIE